MVPAVAVNVAVVLPTPTVTDVGSVSAPALSERVTVAPPVFDTVTVQVELPPDPRLVGLHANLLTTVAVASVIVAVAVLPFSVAVMVAV
jgi:hypothetical protein